MSAGVFLPQSLSELWPLLADGAVPMAGGTDLLARRRGRAPGFVACLERIGELRGVSEEGGLLRLGACETHTSLLGNPGLRERLPILARALAVLGSPLVRNMGTIGGNIVTASPAGDTLPPLYALDAELELASRGGARRLPLAEFIAGPGKTLLGPGEIVSAVLVPVPEAGSGVVQHFEKVGRRKALAIAVVSLAALVRTGPGNVVVEARLALGSVGPTVVRCLNAERELLGRRLDQAALSRAAAAVREEVAPIDDLRASAAYRRDVAGNLLLRLAPPS
ncbi:molybdopterin dehydrogenase FAD-binding protein [Desulfovibrio sp. X2]|uniref:FAD binding domain-containing protein n=1 Tax=Desulfovibrio sp. X2 TaxID=941449 RepID=UPI000358B2F2|nr:xanthine dehydrogenase family protein subunit M [Desulfovibrio sp. X2]EPR37693.1 molybdopterin dehydrogenase FAD-binding protein [Desulfovibrio sp. X2]